jgi:hypothetical protein
MGPGEHRPHDDEYWQRPWARTLFAGDLFEAIPFGNQPTVVYTDEHETPSKHFLGEVAFGCGLLITPTCDMADQHGADVFAHPYRVLIPVVPLDLVIQQTAAVEKRIGLLRNRDVITPYMYLPPLPDIFEGEQVACLFRPDARFR